MFFFISPKKRDHPYPYTKTAARTQRRSPMGGAEGLSLIFKYPLTLKPHFIALISFAAAKFRRSLGAPHRYVQASKQAHLSSFRVTICPFLPFHAQAAGIRPSDVQPYPPSLLPPQSLLFTSLPLRLRFARCRRSLAPTVSPLPHPQSSCFTQRWRQLWSHCSLAAFFRLVVVCVSSAF